MIVSLKPESEPTTKRSSYFRPKPNYLPDVEQIKKNGVKVVVAVGEWGLKRKAWYVEAARILAEKLGGELVTFSSHDGGFMDKPVEWAAKLQGVLHRAEGIPL